MSSSWAEGRHSKGKKGAAHVEAESARGKQSEQRAACTAQEPVAGGRRRRLSKPESRAGPVL